MKNIYDFTTAFITSVTTQLGRIRWLYLAGYDDAAADTGEIFEGALVSMWNSALREKFNFHFQGALC